MTYNIKLYESIKLVIKKINPILLIFLILIVNTSIQIKLISIIGLYIYNRNFNFGIKQKRIPIFYLLMIGLIIIQTFINYSEWENQLLIKNTIAIIYWLISFLILHQLKTFVEKDSKIKIQNTIIIFFILNIILSYIDLFKIMIEIKNINPYSFKGLDSKYSQSTGDYIKGISNSSSIFNTFLSAIGVFYFFYSKKIILTILSLSVLLMTTSNLAVIILIILFIIIIIGDRSRINKVYSVIFISIIVLFYTKISKTNLEYSQKITTTLKKNSEVINKDSTQKDTLLINNKIKDSIQNSIKDISIDVPKQNITEIRIEEKTKKNKETKNKSIQIKRKVKEKIDIENKVLEEYYAKLYDFHSHLQNNILRIYKDSLTESNTYGIKNYPGKIVALIETINFSIANTKNATIGNGAGNYSSKLAFNTSGFMNTQNEKRFTNIFVNHIDSTFKNDHLRIYSFFYAQKIDKHSVINEPYSSYFQLLGEYGFTGCILFIVFYIYYYTRNYRKYTYGKIILPLFLMMLITNYWFEELSIVIIFELLMFLDLTKEEKK